MFDELLTDGTIDNIDFSAHHYFPEYQHHLKNLQALDANENTGPLLRAQLKKWAAVGW